MANVHEIWKDIPNYEGLYQASNLGRIKRIVSNRCRKERIISQCILKSGYRFTGLCKDKIKKTFTAHRLIALTFIPNDQSKTCINHIDGNKANNVVSNLEWVTYKENTRHAINTGLTKSRGSSHPMAKLNETTVLQIRDEYSMGTINRADLAAKYGIKKTMLAYIVTGKYWKHIV